jgi:molybdopterin-dependent oxidoreductase alpha subunit
MVKDAPLDDPGDDGLKVGRLKHAAAGATAVAVSMKRAQEQMGVRRSLGTLSRVNQVEGFDCPGCAWPEPHDRSTFEFCENGVKAVAEEATTRRVTAEFFAEHPVADLAERSGYWLGQQGRLTQPVHKPAGSDHYQPVSWDRAFSIVAEHLRGLPSPDAAAFYTSGRTSNEAAFAYQLFVRRFGTNNLPDCSNMCHESSTSALLHSIGIGKASVLIDDVHHTDLILIVGQNPGTNHPRMLTALEKAKANGATIVAVNPLPEAGLGTFHNPQSLKGLTLGTRLADDHLPIRLAGDQALFAALGKLVLERGAEDREFLEAFCSEFEEYAAKVAALSWDDVLTATGLERAQIEGLADRFIAADRVIACWAMGLTQHREAVATIGEVVNLLLLRGHIGRPGAGVLPVRGHSNVQGDRTMGIWEKMPDWWLDRLAAEFGFDPPREPGLDTVDTIRAMQDGRVRVFVGMGGNFAAATPDSAATEEALRSLDLTVQVSTKLNRSHAVPGREALILPCLGRTEKDLQDSGPQDVTVEDSMCMVHKSRGRLAPASPELLSEVGIVTRLAEQVLGARDGVDDVGIDWQGMRADYRVVRQHIAAVVPGFEDFERRLAEPGGFALPHPPRDSRTFPTATGRARFTLDPVAVLEVPAGHLLLQTVRSHDQFNTTIYGLDDRYRGVHQGRRVVFVNEGDLADLGLSDGQLVDLESVHPDGTRRAKGFRVVEYPTARGCVAAYYPETNVLLSLNAVAKGSNTPVMKSVVVRLLPQT